jgi:hypothetical protein
MACGAASILRGWGVPSSGAEYALSALPPLKADISNEMGLTSLRGPGEMP